MNTINVTCLSAMAAEALAICKDSVVHNLALIAKCPYSETETTFVMSHDSQATKWQLPTCPNDLFICHGEYIHRAGDGIQNVVNELQKKSDSSRACISLINMQDIINSHDNPIPSFMVLQFGFPENTHQTLIATAYFRAIEVSRFLPINIAEISQIIRRIKLSFPAIESIEIHIFAFKAYANPKFHCLQKAAIDTIKPAHIAKAVSSHNYSQLRNLLDSKMLVDASVIYTEGLKNLCDAIEVFPEGYDPLILEQLYCAVESMETLRSVRESSSHSSSITELNKNIREHLTAARDLLKET